MKMIFRIGIAAGIVLIVYGAFLFVNQYTTAEPVATDMDITCHMVKQVQGTWRDIEIPCPAVVVDDEQM